jgi:predicted secreted protein
MPRRLVMASVAQLGLNVAELDADGAYALALAMGTSYAATIHHLGDTGLIDRATRDRLARVPPQRIKRGLSTPGATGDAWKDIRVVRLRNGEVGREVRAEQGDAVVVEVPEVPSSGYVWEAASLSSGLALAADEYRAPEMPALGGRGWHRFLVRVDGAGHQLLRLDLRRTWQAGPPEESIQVDITAEPVPTPGIVEPRVLVPAA